ncbi:MAG: hypothetical protein WC717_00035 [Candidatus Micrarchaeia archaeon]|jgi:hypothetical protein
MANEKLISFILKARQNGQSEEQVLRRLLSVGWKQEAVAEAFSEIKSQKAAVQPAQAAPQQPSSPPWANPAPAQPAAIAQQPQAVQPQPTPSQSPEASAQQASQQPPSLPAQPSPAALSGEQPKIPPAIQAPQPAQPSALPPASQITLPPLQKKSLFSSLFGKKQPQAPAEPAQQAAGAPPASPKPLPAQTTLQPPAIPKKTAVPGQSTIGTFAGGGQSAQAAASQAPGTASATQQGAAASQAQPGKISLPPIKQEGGLKKFLPIIAFIVLVAAAAGAYYLFVMIPAGSAAPPESTPPVAPPVQNISPSVPIQQAAGPVDCGTDMDCLARAASSCQAANATQKSTTDLFGLLVSSTMYMETWNTSEEGKCLFFVRLADSSVKLGDAMVAAARAKGVSLEDIKKQEDESTAYANASVGMNGTCRLLAGDLSLLIARWKSGSYSSSDLSGAACTGKLFEGSSAISLPAPAANSSKNSTVANSTKANATAESAAKNTSSGPANATSGASAANATNATPPVAFAYTRRYSIYYPEKLSWFCGDRGMEFYRMHWKDYYGGDCSSEKGIEGYVNMTGYVATGCTLLPCCINGPYKEYSRLYDYFECGYN